MTAKRFIIGLTLASLLAMCIHRARADDWTPTNKLLFGTFVGLQAIDVAQTNYIRTHQDRFREAGIYGNPPNMAAVVGVKAALTYGVYYVSKDMNAAERNLLFGVLDVIQLGVVGHNYRVGITVPFK